MEATVHNCGSWVRYWAERTPEALAVVDGDRRIDWATLESRVARLAGGLRQRGVVRGDRVGIVLHNRSAYLETVFAAARLGAICLPINTRLAPPEIAYLLADCTPRALVIEAELADPVARSCEIASHTPATILETGGGRDAYETVLAEATPVDEIVALSPDDAMILMYTSGTTGQPKGALLPHRKALFNSLNAQLVFAIGRDDRVLVASPLFHSLALQIISLPVAYAGGCLVLQPRVDPAEIWRTVEREKIAFFGSVPSVHQQMADELETLVRAGQAPDLASLRFCFTAGAAVSVDLIRTFERHGLVLKQGYGQTETSMLCCLEERDAIARAGSVGRPLHHLELRVVALGGLDDPPGHWRDVAPGETGEIVVRGPITMLGYWGHPEASAQVLREEGWLRTNDLATRDAEGFVTLCGRARDMYISGGENVYPAQVEAVYGEHPAIREIAVVGVPHPRWGETGRAHVVVAAGHELDREALLAWGRERLARFKLPDEFVREETLPRTASGKVQKHRLAGIGRSESAEA